MQGGVLVECLLQSGVGAFQFGDGGGPVAGALLLLLGDVGDHPLQAEVDGQEPGERGPLGTAVRQPPACAPATMTALANSPSRRHMPGISSSASM